MSGGESYSADTQSLTAVHTAQSFRYQVQDVHGAGAGDGWGTARTVDESGKLQ